MKKILLFCFVALFLVACHRKSIPETTLGGTGKLMSETGYASYYSDKLNGHSTASGEPYNSSKYTAAHKKLPLGTMVQVTNTVNGKSIIVRVNDRGPYVSGRIIDLSKAAASALGLIGSGTAKVIIQWRSNQ